MEVVHLTGRCRELVGPLAVKTWCRILGIPLICYRMLDPYGRCYALRQGFLCSFSLTLSTPIIPPASSHIEPTLGGPDNGVPSHHPFPS